jgi:hypothetical protein
MARIELGWLTGTDAKLLLRCVRTEPRLSWFAHELEEQLIHQPPVAPWRKVAGRGRGLHAYEELECGHRYHLRYSKNWMEDHATKRRCQQCLREQDRAALVEKETAW